MANTIQDKLTYLSGTKDAIKQAIIGKGVEVTDTDTFRSYADKITSIQSGGSIAGLPSGIRFGNSRFITVPVEIIPYLESQTDMMCMFSDCSLLKTAPQFDTSSVTSMYMMFLGCISLETISQLDTSSVTSMGYMFNNCPSLKTVPLLNVFNTTDIDYMFNYCNSLTNLGGFTGLKLNLDLTSSPVLTVDSVMNIINNAADMTSEPKTLTLHKDVFNKLTQEQIATASAKGWNIASA